MMDFRSDTLEQPPSLFRALSFVSFPCSHIGIVTLPLAVIITLWCFHSPQQPYINAEAGLSALLEGTSLGSVVVDTTPNATLLVDVHIISDKPKSFHRTYEFFILANGLRTLIVHDASATQSALSVAVDSGSLDNPEYLKGLAHFCEHMLFLGTEKYPEAGSFARFVANVGGQNNAWTAEEETIFYLVASSKSSEEATERFADFFRAPLFSTEFVDKELQAIQSEHDKNKEDGFHRTFEILRSLANPKSPVSWFMVGDLESLKEGPAALNIDPIDELKQYFKRSYCPSRMRLVMHGSEAPEEQRRRAEKYFGSIPKGSMECQAERRSRIEPKPWTPDRLGKFVVIETNSPKGELWLQFILPPTLGMWVANPIVYLNHVIQYAGDSSWQRAFAGLLYGISVTLREGSYGTEMYVMAPLTPVGELQYNIVIDIFFQYISILRRQGVDEKLYKSIGKVMNLRWEWQEQATPADEASRLAKRLLRYPAERVLSANQRVDVPNVSLVSELMDLLHPDNMNVALIVPDAQTRFFAHGTEVLTLPHYDARYMVFKLSTALPCHAQKWSSWLNGQVEHASDNLCPPTPSNDSSMVNASVIPHPPPFIENVPDELDTTHMHALRASVNSREVSAVALYGLFPSRITTSVSSLLSPKRVLPALGKLQETDAFYREGWIIESPKVNINFLFEAPRSEKSFEGGLANQVRLSIYQKLLAQDMGPKLYDVRMTGCDYSVALSPYYVAFSFNGFAPVVPVMMKQVLDMFGEPVDIGNMYRIQLAFDDIRMDLLTYSDMPVAYAVSDRNVLVTSGQASREDHLALLNTITVESVISSMSELLKKPLKLTGLAMGNLGQNEAEEAFGSVIAIANQWEGAKASPGVDEEIRRVVPIVHPKQPVEVRRLNQRPNDPNDVVVSSYLIGLATVELRVLAGLLAPTLHATAFEELRTNRQLGYLVEASISQLGNVFYVNAMVQGSTLNADEVEGAIEYIYHTAFPATLNLLTDKDVDAMVSSLTSKLLHPPVSPADEVTFFWSQIIAGKDCLDLIDEMLSYLQDSVTKSVLIDFWNSVTYPAGPRTKVTVKHFAKVVPPRPSKLDSIKIWKAQGVPDTALARLEQEYDETMILTTATSADRKRILDIGGLYPTEVICKRSPASQGSNKFSPRTPSSTGISIALAILLVLGVVVIVQRMPRWRSSQSSERESQSFRELELSTVLSSSAAELLVRPSSYR